MQLLLPDTSVWVDYLRHGQGGRTVALREQLEARQAVVCGPVVAELIAGTRREDAERLGGLLSGLPWADIDRAGWRRIGQVAGALRRAGTAVALTDITIAVAAIQAGATVWTADTDFVRIQSAAPELRVQLLT